MAIVFGHEIHIFIPKSTEGGWGNGLGNIPNNKQFFFSASLSERLVQMDKYLRGLSIPD